MAFERFWLEVPARLFSADGGANGLITIPTTSGFKVKQNVKISAIALPTLSLEVKRVISPTQLYVGPHGQNIDSRTNVSAYTVAALSVIQATQQARVSITPVDHERAVYEEEPTLAKRVVNVDEWGRFYTVQNPVPVQLSDGSVNIGTVNAELEVELTHKDDYPHLGDIADSVRIGDGEDELAINPDGSINVNFSGSSASNLTIINKQILLANTEYSVTIPITTKKIQIRNRKEGKVQYCFVSGESNTNYITMFPGNSEIIDGLQLSAAKTLYLRTIKDNQIAEILLWS